MRTLSNRLILATACLLLLAGLLWFGGFLRAPPANRAEAGPAGRSLFQGTPVPEGVTFVARETAVDSRGEASTLVQDEAAVAAPGWSQPVLFYPDGTSSTACVILENERGRCIEVSLRGLTAVVTVGEVFTGLLQNAEP